MWEGRSGRAGSDQGASISPVGHFPPCMWQIITNFRLASASPSVGLRAARQFSISDIRMNCMAVACCIKTCRRRSRRRGRRAGGRAGVHAATLTPPLNSHTMEGHPRSIPTLALATNDKKYDNIDNEIGTKRPTEQDPTMISPRPECLSTQLSFYLHIFGSSHFGQIICPVEEEKRKRMKKDER